MNVEGFAVEWNQLPSLVVVAVAVGFAVSSAQHQSVRSLPSKITSRSSLT